MRVFEPIRSTTADVLIVGGGFCGSWLAYFLKRQHPGLEITIVERDFINLGASTRNAGFLSCGNISEWFEDLSALGWEETTRTLTARIEGIEIIRRELGMKLEINNCGSFDFDEPSGDKIALMNKLNGFLESTGRGTLFEVQAARIGGSSRQAFHNRFDGEVDPLSALQNLHQLLVDEGVRFLWNCLVERIGEGSSSVIDPSGETHTLVYRHAFVCTNAFARRLNRATTVLPARGQVIVTSPCETDTERSLGFLRSGYDYFRFIGERVLVGGGRLNFKQAENTDEVATTNDLKKYLIALAREVIGHDKFTVEHHWSGIMGLGLGGHASITEMEKPVFIDSKTQEIAGCGGWGVTLMPYIARHHARLFGGLFACLF